MAQSKQFEYCELLYSAMLEKAEGNVVNGFARYVGKITELANELGLSIEAYSKAKRQLMMMECMREIRKGVRNNPSEYDLIKPPTKEAFDGLDYMNKNMGAPQRRRFERVEQEIKELQDRVKDLETALEHALREAV